MISGSPMTSSPPTPICTHLLWDNGQGTAAVWRISPAGETTKRQFGPFDGWAARALAVGPEGTVHLLWTGRDGIASVWSVPEDGPPRQTKYGPFAGWEARALAVGADNTQHLLWNRADGTAIVWSIRPEQMPEALHFGPYDGWSATGLAVGPDNQIHLLWNCRDGQAGVWRWASGSGTESEREGESEAEVEMESQIAFGPFDGWRAAAVAGGCAGVSRLLWQGENGRASLWTVSGAEPGEPDGGEEQPQPVYGPFEGWTATGAACGPDDSAHILWRYQKGGMASVWRIEADGEFTHEEHGPYTGWAPVALAAGR